ncbi:MAG: glutathione S-transferase N-terminal domain-containing protein [Gammaproteobacteria bacterium]|jgi:RNA polymerase-associated protein|nr:glutathione S-transferase N-terminal domain-containing protein [Gammaproteobacteria bacterium]
MALVANRRSVMTLFSDPSCPQSHRTRIVIAEKDITVDVIYIDPDDKPEDLSDLNPYNSIPTLVDRDLVLYDSRVIMEYLDERFPHPPLMPVDPVSRARSRIALYHVERDWYGLVADLTDGKKASAARKVLRESLLSSVDIFRAKPFFLSDEFTLVDCCVAPILWRLEHFGVDLPAQAKPIKQYADRMFARPSFRESLSEAELEMHP